MLRWREYWAAIPNRFNVFHSPGEARMVSEEVSSPGKQAADAAADEEFVSRRGVWFVPSEAPQLSSSQVAAVTPVCQAIVPLGAGNTVNNNAKSLKPVSELSDNRSGC